MILSLKEIEEIAAGIIKDFNRAFFGDAAEGEPFVRATPIDQFAKEYLGLDVTFARLSGDGSICGLTAYADTEYIHEENGCLLRIPLKKNQILLDSSFLEVGQVEKLCGKRRFTLAHECAHQLLFQMESDEVRNSCKARYAAYTPYSCRDLKTKEDWNEWQANALGAAILMPQSEIDRAMWYFAQSRKLLNYEGWFTYCDRVVITCICNLLGVSKSALVIRLEQLGYIENRKRAEYFDPLEIWE